MNMQSLKWGVLAITGFLFLASCSNTAHIEKAKGANLSNYKTYNWVENDTEQKRSIIVFKYHVYAFKALIILRHGGIIKLQGLHAKFRHICLG